MPHANWKGNISFGLVNIPIQLYSSEEPGTHISFKQIDKRTGDKIKYKRINVETEEEVPWEEIGKAYQYSKDTLLPVEEGELKKVAGENAKTIAIETFVDKKNINFLNVFRAYYLVPDKKGEKGYVILREALTKMNKIGVAKIIISTREYLAAVATLENALVVYLLRYEDEIRKLSELDFPAADIKKYKVSNKEIEIAKKLISSMSSTWKPALYKDEFKEAVEKWVENKIHHLPEKKMRSRAISKKSTGKVVDFVDLLKKSLQSSKPSKKPAVTRKKTPGILKKTGKHYSKHIRH